MPSQDNENAMDGLLRRSLVRDSASGRDCPDAELLAAYFDQSLGADEAAGYELHFSSCPRCREQLAAMARTSTEQILEPDLSLEPALAGARPVQAIASEAARTPAQAKPAVSAPRSEVKSPQRKSPGAQWLDLRWLVPVAAMLVLGTFVFMRFASHENTSGLNNQLAVSKPAAPPQYQIAPEPEKQEKQAGDVGTWKKQAPANKPSPGAASTAQPSASPPASVESKSEPAGTQRNEGAAAGAAGARSAPSRNALTATTKGSSAAASGASTLQSRKQVGEAISGAAVAQDSNLASEPAPPAPAPELNASLPSIVVGTSSVDAVKSPAPAPPQTADKKSESFAVNGRFRGSTAAKSLAKTKPAEERYTETVISTPDSDVFYRVAGGGFVEISEDGGATWQRQLLNPSAEFTAGSAPEPRICWLVGRSGVVFLTEDGKSWRKLSSPTSEDLVAVVAKSASSATVTATEDRKWSTDDAGKNWHPVK